MALSNKRASNTSADRLQEGARANQITPELLLLQFTGSDWCPPCRMMQRDVFSAPQFKEYASKNFVLVEIDFPRRKAQSPELLQQNQSLAQRYHISVFPTVIILDSEGRKIGELAGYDPGAGLPGFIAELEKIRKG